MAGAEGRPDRGGGARGGPEARTSLTAFVLGGSVAAVPLLLSAPPPALLAGPGFQGRAALALHVAGVNAALLLAWGRSPGGMYQIAIRACFLGFAFGCGLLLSFGQSTWKHFGWYMCSLSFFHYSEYLVTAVNNPRSLSLDSFLLNHSFEYNMAALSSWVEFTVEKCIFPEMKQITWLSSAGLLMVVFGDCLRKAAMLTAGSNFNHIVQNEKSETHTLVTRGVYGWFRHPSYVGWFYWSIGTQSCWPHDHGDCLRTSAGSLAYETEMSTAPRVRHDWTQVKGKPFIYKWQIFYKREYKTEYLAQVLLCNPVCVVGYTLASWRFFRERIEEEEMTLVHFFGEEYLAYKRRVPTGLPFIRGIKAEL